MAETHPHPPCAPQFPDLASKTRFWYNCVGPVEFGLIKGTRNPIKFFVPQNPKFLPHAVHGYMLAVRCIGRDKVAVLQVSMLPLHAAECCCRAAAAAELPVLQSYRCLRSQF